VLDLLAQFGDEAKLLAGGQSLVPLMNFRLARPAHLIDLNGVAQLDYLHAIGGQLVIGAMTRQRSLERSPVAARWPLVSDALQYVGHTPIRVRGTVGGSLSHADPAAELPAVMTALDAEFMIHSRRGQRTTGTERFFRSYLTTSLEADELLVEIRVPPLPPRTGWSFHEVSRRHGDFAVVGVAALVTLGLDDAIERGRLVFVGAGATPQRSNQAEAALAGGRPGDAFFREVADIAVRTLDPPADVHGSVEYRRETAAIIGRRALVEAAARGAERSG
jgi:carbon-monoxide dehydrogenase medium subunit